jgi:hypothetical protein
MASGRRCSRCSMLETCPAESGGGAPSLPGRHGIFRRDGDYWTASLRSGRDQPASGRRPCPNDLSGSSPEVFLTAALSASCVKFRRVVGAVPRRRAVSVG